MKKKLLLVTGLCLCIADFAMAKGLEFQAGVGYYGSFFGNPLKVKNGFTEAISMFTGKYPNGSVFVRNMPIGFGIYAGIGYGFRDPGFSFGVEPAISLAISVKPTIASYFSIEGRGFVKYDLSEDFSITGFGGVKGNTSLIANLPNGVYPKVGVRINPHLLYLEYGIVVAKNFSRPFSHDIGIGITIE